jgi:N-acetylmuramidase
MTALEAHSVHATEARTAANPGTVAHWALPTTGAALPLVPADFAAAARQLGVATAAVHAVAAVESGGRTGFDARKRPIIRYENHVFRRLTHARYDRSHPDLSAGYNSAQYRSTHRFGGTKYADEQWALLHAAFALAPDQAVMSCSWGMFQVMGENYRNVGWLNVHQFVEDMFSSANQHLRAFLGFCRHAGLVPYLKTHQWARFAQGYNGPSYRTNHYDTQLAHYYAQYSRGGA